MSNGRLERKPEPTERKVVILLDWFLVLLCCVMVVVLTLAVLR